MDSLGGFVKKIIMARSIRWLLCYCAIAMAPSLAFTDQTVDECSKELLLAYFPEPFVIETLKKFNVNEAQWDIIQKELSNKDKEVIKLVEQKASQMDPNPLKDPQARQAAVKLFRETLLQIFSDVLKAHGVTDEQEIQAMLENVQQLKAQRFAKCMQKPELKSSRSSNQSDSNE